MSTKYVKIYYAIGSNNVRHVYMQDTPFESQQGLSEDDTDIEYADYELVDMPLIASARHVMQAIRVDGQGRARIDKQAADLHIPNVAARGHKPQLVPKNNHERSSIRRPSRSR